MDSVDDPVTATQSPRWCVVKFGDVVRNVDVVERAPLEAGLDRYVGLEHLDPESLHIRRWGLIEGGTSFTRKFIVGQVLFGKRRAYQRKVAKAEFDGICSGDILVFEPADDRLLPELLPFMVQSEGFFRHALGTSAGSLSPRTKWRDLANYEFALPQLDEQRRITDLLWVADEAEEAWTRASVSFLALIRAQLSTTFGDPFMPMSRLSAHVAHSAYGPRFAGNLYTVNGRLGCIRTTDLQDDGMIVYKTVPKVDLDPADFAEHILQPGDFMISRSGTCGIACVYETQAIPMIPGAFLIRIRLRNSLHPLFLKEYVNSPVGRRHMEKLAQGAVQQNIRGSLLLEERIPSPPMSEQQRLISLFADLREHHAKIVSHIANLRAMRALLLELSLTAEIGADDQRVQRVH